MFSVQLIFDFFVFAERTCIFLNYFLRFFHFLKREKNWWMNCLDEMVEVEENIFFFFKQKECE